MKFSNHLLHEVSPYLQQHAHNPVDWFPWGQEAFARATAEDKPIFLSIGYSTCHWCHVMEHESFEDETVAQALNKDFICIKVDREERPDIDAVYMSACQAMTGQGGWPLSVFMAPDQSPFFVGTYFPKERRYGQAGLLEILQAIEQAWHSDRTRLLEASNQLTAALLSNQQDSSSFDLGPAPIKRAISQLERSFDPVFGGFGRTPRFPMAHNLLFLLQGHVLGLGQQCLPMVEKTLEGMYVGGIFDHIGGGFSRYSTDGKWLVPHFEKMLYDNALLVMAYTQAYQVTKKPLYRIVVERTLGYIQREMTAADGSFYSAQDADSDGEEGKFYTFSPDEIYAVLGQEAGRSFCQQYDISEQGNFEGKSIPNRIGKSPDVPDEATSDALELLYQQRLTRYQLHKDDKALTAWNSLMIVAYAKAARVLDRGDYLEQAENSFAFIQKHLTGPDNRLQVSHRAGTSTGRGLLDDYVFFSWACLELYDSTFDPKYLACACQNMELVRSLFSNPKGGFYLSPQDGERLIYRPTEQYDGALPCGNSVAAWCFTRLWALTGDTTWQQSAHAQFDFYGSAFQSHPTAVVFAAYALMQVVYPSQELVCVMADDGDRALLAQRLGAHIGPQTAVLVKTPKTSTALSAIAPLAESYPIPDRGTLYYFCREHICQAPTDNLSQILNQLLEIQ